MLWICWMGGFSGCQHYWKGHHLEYRMCAWQELYSVTLKQSRVTAFEWVWRKTV